jgi:hypothetical protein
VVEVGVPAIGADVLHPHPEEGPGEPPRFRFAVLDEGGVLAGTFGDSTLCSDDIDVKA